MKVVVNLILLLFFLDNAFSFKFTTRFTPQQDKQRQRFELNVINIPIDSLDTSTLTLDSFRDTSLSTSINFDDLQNLAVLLSVGLYFAYEKRPRGSANAELVEVKRSSVQSANLGLFCKSFIPQGTSLGFYPGVLVPAEFALKKKRNETAQQAAKRYMWLVNDENGGTVLDPTNPDGVLSPKISYFFGFYEVNTLMARINEPPLGKDCNVVIKSFENSADLEIVAERDILGGEELFIDYGRSYDRSSYGSDSSSDSESTTDTTIDNAESRRMKEREAVLKKEQLAKRQEEIDMMTIQPISKRNRDLEFDPTGNNNNNNVAFGRGNSNNDDDDDDDLLDQDTTRPSDGFISNLRKQERESKNLNKNNPANGKKGSSGDKGSGIIAPEEGMSLFNEIGPGMFSSTGLEDIEIMNELLDKKNINKKNQSNNVEVEEEEENNSSNNKSSSSSSPSSSSDWLEVTDFRQMKKDKQNNKSAASKDEIDFVDSILNKSSPSSSSNNNNNNSGSGSWNRNIDYNNEDPLAALRAKLLSQKADAKKQSSVGDEEDSGLAAEVNDEIESLLSELRSKSSSTSSSSTTTAGKGFGKKSTPASPTTDVKPTSDDDDDFLFVEEFGVSKINFSDIFKTPLSEDDEDEDDFVSSSDALVRESILKTSNKNNKIKIDTKNLDDKIAAGEIVDGSEIIIADTKDDEDDDSNSNNDDEEISVVVPKLTPEVAEDLTNKLEEMTDDEVKDIFRKIRLSLDTDRTMPAPPAAVADAIASLQNPIPKQQSAAEINLFAAIKDQKIARQKQLQSEEAAEEFKKKYPKSKPVNPEIREKYKAELSKFEAELETLYKDPLSVWEELIKNPDIMKDLIPPSIANDIDSSKDKK